MTPETVLDFWLHEVGEKGWYVRDEALDARIRDLFLPAWEQADSVARDWAATPRGALAALILTDQFPRNMFRGDARSYATDPLARDIATEAIARGFDLQTDPPARQFFYLPFMHSEDLTDQGECITLFADRMPGDSLDHARHHEAVIKAFGRFPWRNDDLGRDTTPAEQALLDAGGYGALVSGRYRLD